MTTRLQAVVALFVLASLPSKLGAQIVVPQSGFINTVAGEAEFTFSGDGSAASSATLYAPTSVAVDSSGNLYIVDAGNDRVRKVTASTGIITTIAGNGTYGFSGDGAAATSAELSSPYSVAVDSSGNLYIADSGNDRIRKVTASTGIITTVAGNGTYGFTGDGGQAGNAEMDGPSGVAVDTSGNLYIADTFNNRIRKVTVSTGIITTVAGNGDDGYYGDGGSATSASLSAPSGVKVDASGNLFITDQANNVVRKVTASSKIITTVAGNSYYGFYGDGGPATSAEFDLITDVAVDTIGNLYITDGDDDRVREVTASTGIIATIAGNGIDGYSGDGGAASTEELSNPNGVAVDSAGNLYIADQGNSRIRKITASTEIMTTIAGNGPPGFSGDGKVATTEELSAPSSVVVDSSGNLYIADSANKRVRKVTASTGLMTTIAGSAYTVDSGDGGPATSAGFASLTDVVVDSSGNLYISESLDHRVRKVTASTGIITTIAGTGTQGFAGDGGAAVNAELFHPSGLGLDASGNLYIADQFNGRVRKVTASTGIITTIAGNGTQSYSGDGGAATSAELYFPTGVTFDTAGNLYIADRGNNRIREVMASTGVITTVAGGGVQSQGFTGDGGPATSAVLSSPSGVAVDSAGNIYIADSDNFLIRRVIASTGIIATLAGNGAQGFSGDGGAATGAEFATTPGVALDAAGNLYIADQQNNRIRIEGGPLKSEPVLHWAAPSSITYGTALSSTQLAATSSVPGTFVYSPAAGTIPPAGSDTLSVTFTPTDNTNYLNTAKSVSLTVAQARPTLAFAAVAAKTYGTAPFTVNASSASTGAVTYSISSGPASISGSTVTITGAGTVTIAASQAATANYASATSSTSFTVSQATPVLTFSAIATQTYGAAPFTVSASSASTGAITYSISSGPATISGSTVTITGAGTVTIAASQAATANYTAVGAGATLTVNPATPVLTLAGIATQTYGASPFTVSASSASTGAVTYSISSGPASISGSTVTITGAGTVTVAASQAAVANYTSATSSTSFPVSPAVPTLTFATIGTQTYGAAPFTVSASSASSGAITYSISSGPATISGSAVTITGAGTVNIAASQAATSNYTAAGVGATFSIAKATPVITWATPSSIQYGTALSNTQLNASANVQGSFVYSPSAGTIPPAGIDVLQATFTPTDSTDYTSVTTSVSLTVISPYPTITSLNKTSGAPGLAVVITGFSFGTAAVSNTVTFNGTPAGILNWTSSSITAIVPGGATTGPVVVTPANGQISNNNIMFTVNTSSCPY